MARSQIIVDSCAQSSLYRVRTSHKVIYSTYMTGKKRLTDTMLRCACRKSPSHGCRKSQCHEVMFFCMLT